MKRSPLPILPFVSVLLLLAVSGWTARAQEPQALPLLEAFETFEQGMPPGWSDDSQGELSVTFGGETRRPKEGKSAWRIGVPAWHAGAAQVKRGRIPLRSGGTYVVEVWLRSENLGVPVTVMLRKQSAPFTPYLARQFYVGTEWRRCALEGRAPEDDPDAGLYLSFGGSGALLVDSLRVLAGELAVEPDPAPPAPVKGNRVFNSSFELGTDGWTMPETVALVAASCPDGTQFARWLPNPYPLEGRPFTARPGQTYTISAYFRSQRPGARARLQAVEVGNAVRVGQTFTLGPEWKRCAFTATLPCEQYSRYYLSIGPAEEEHGIDIDAVQVEEGPLAEYRPAASVEVSTGLTRAAMFPRPNEVIGVPAQVHARDGAPEGAALRYRLEGFYGETLAWGTEPIRAGLNLGEIPLRVRIPASGTLRLVIEAVVETTVLSSAEAVLTALPPLEGNRKPDPGSFFGAHGSVGTPGEWHAPTVAARAGVRWWRLHDLSAFTQWSVAEPEPDRFVWYDAPIQALRQRGFSILGVFARTPEWAGVDSGSGTDPSARPPAKIADLADYVRQVVTHYRGKIEAYEIWNEPWARTFWAGTPEQYAEVAKAVSRAARSADPGVRLVGGCFFVPRPEFTDRVLAKGLAPAIDAVSHHHYTEPLSVAYTQGGKDQVTRWSEQLRARLDAVTQTPGKMPLWNTESGTACPGFYSWLGAEEQSRASARTVAKTLILNKAAGVQRFFYYHLWQEIGGPRLFSWSHQNNWSLLDYDGSGKPALAAYAACAQNLEGAVPAGRVESRALKAYLFRKGSGTVVALWSPPALSGPRELELGLHPYRVGVANLMNNPVGIVFSESEARSFRLKLRNEPVYMHVRDTSPDAVAKAFYSSRWVGETSSG